MAEYGVLLVSGIGHQAGYVTGFTADPRCQIVAVADVQDTPPDREKANRALAQKLEVPYIPDLDEALARQDVHIASVCAEIERRGPVAAKCALAGKHIFLDKPSAGSVKDANLIAEAVEQTGVRSQMMSYNNSPWALEAKQVVADGRTGRVIAIHGDAMIAKATVGEIPPGFVRQETEKSTQPFEMLPDCKREMFVWAVYSLCLIHQLAGTRPKRVFGMTGNYFSAKHLERDVEDLGSMLLTMEDGTTVSVTGARLATGSHPTGGWNRVTIVGTDDVLTFDHLQPHLEVYCGEADNVWWATIQDPQQTDVGRRDIGAFIDCIVEGREPEINARTAAAVVEVLLAGYVSAARKKAVTLPLTQR